MQRFKQVYHWVCDLPKWSPNYVPKQYSKDCIFIGIGSRNEFRCDTCQGMLFAYKIVKSLGLKVKLPMKVAVDNNGTVFLANGWSTGGGTQHVEVKTNFLQEMKETGMFKFQWI